MIILEKTISAINEQLKTGAVRATNYKPTLKIVSHGHYLVQSESNKSAQYNVKCFVDAIQRKVVLCDCKANVKGFVCKHVAVAVPIHISAARSRR
jgi:hypothetical protein